MQPFSTDARATLASLGEKALLREVRRWLGAAAPPAPFGMGDDCAELPRKGPRPRLITTDSLVLGRHFEAATPPGAAGAKLLKRSLSDIAAMGGKPAQAVLAGLLPRTVRIDWLRAFVEGLAACALEHGVDLAGGDLSETAADLAFNLTLLGTGTGRLLYRSGARPGDWIAVTGALGGSRLGRHLSFTPRLREGRALAREPRVRSCIDVSDGLAIDLCALLPDGAGAALDTAAIPLHPDARAAAAASGHAPLWHALHDGEDHELLFTVAPMAESEWAALSRRLGAAGRAPVTRIGTVVTGAAGAVFDAATGAPLDLQAGYDHFR